MAQGKSQEEEGNEIHKSSYKNYLSFNNADLPSAVH